ncbi:hypothetical protein SLA2020_122260 [Shorea laevis]
MNSTNTTNSDSGGGFGNNIGSFGYGVGVSVGILLLITTITLTSYFCTTRTSPPPSQSTRRRSRLTSPGDRHGREPSDDDDPHSYVVDVGLEDDVIKSYPTLLYSEANLRKKDSDATCCSICLADYKSSDKLRMLPDCNHLFHLKCIDPWLRLHPTCPLCRTSPLPTPLSTPLAEVVPLASRRD